jgi:hypothetical protein
MAIGALISPSMMNNHCQPFFPKVPFMPLYTAACKYPENMDAAGDEA